MQILGRHSPVFAQTGRRAEDRIRVKQMPKEMEIINEKFTDKIQ